MIEFADGTDGRWKPVPLTAAASGQASIQAPAGSVVSVRSAVKDAAGNQGRQCGSGKSVLTVNRGTAWPVTVSRFEASR